MLRKYGILRIMKAHWRKYAAIVIILATLYAFYWYVKHNPAVITTITDLPKSLFVTLILLYLLVVAAMGLVFVSTIRLTRVRLGFRESFLVTAYSSVINFFGPLQSGPAFRAVYLKQKHGIKIAHYTAATILFYLFFAIISGIFLLSGLLGWWMIPAVIAGLICLYIVWSKTNLADKVRVLDLREAWLLLFATFLQIALVTVIYWVELRHIDTSITISQAIIYTGAANFALFVSLTPGAIGFREAFLVFSQGLHHIDTSTIVAASLIDRAVYLVILGILAVGIFGTHAQAKLQIAKPKTKSLS